VVLVAAEVVGELVSGVVVVGNSLIDALVVAASMLLLVLICVDTVMAVG
jgi:hypothetical protein